MLFEKFHKQVIANRDAQANRATNSLQIADLAPHPKLLTDCFVRWAAPEILAIPAYPVRAA